MKQRHVVLGVNSHGIAKCICGARWPDGEPHPTCPASQGPYYPAKTQVRGLDSLDRKE